MSFLSIAARVAEQDTSVDKQGQQTQVGYIKHEKGKGYCVKSDKNPDWSGGCYPSKAEAEKRLSQVEMFKHMKKGSVSPESIAHDIRLISSRLSNSKKPCLDIVLSDIHSVISSIHEESNR